MKAARPRHRRDKEFEARANTIRGIRTGADVARLRSVGYQAFLVGESLMKQPSPGDALRKLLADASADESKWEAARQ